MRPSPLTVVLAAAALIAGCAEPQTVTRLTSVPESVTTEPLADAVRGAGPGAPASATSGLFARATPSASRDALPESVLRSSIDEIGAAAGVDLGGTPGAVATPAQRTPAIEPGSVCDMVTARAIVDRNGPGQYIITRSPSATSTSAVVDVVIAVASTVPNQPMSIVCQRGSQAAFVGRTGVRPIADRRSGDGTTPAGVFPLGQTTAPDGEQFSFFGNGPNPGVQAGYRAVKPGDCWGATPGSSSYNKLVTSYNCVTPDEYLPRFTNTYVHAAVIGANLGPEISGDAPGETPYAAAIFLHHHNYGPGNTVIPTSGCVSLALPDLIDTITLIDPRLTPRFAIGTTEWLRATGGGG
jgi:L,D-peptidoglycan transpeptidase YkuD (ErfK/YbiS/YcfS/YnhG family)